MPDNVVRAPRIFAFIVPYPFVAEPPKQVFQHCRSPFEDFHRFFQVKIHWICVLFSKKRHNGGKLAWQMYAGASIVAVDFRISHCSCRTHPAFDAPAGVGNRRFIVFTARW
jgi:hypothetical protein